VYENKPNNYHHCFLIEELVRLPPGLYPISNISIVEAISNLEQPSSNKEKDP
jgi:hypothetical protein